MNKPDEQFNEKLTQHYNERKARTRLSHAQQQALKHSVIQNNLKAWLCPATHKPYLRTGLTGFYSSRQ